MNTLIQHLQNKQLYAHSVSAFNIIETHSSYLILTGDYAYKIKKAVNYGFLDYSTLEKRKYYCEQELTLNTFFAPELYLSVVKICGSPTHPFFDEAGEAIEYAVKMKQFPQDALFSSFIAQEKLENRHLMQLAKKLAHLHQYCRQKSEAIGLMKIRQKFMPRKMDLALISRGQPVSA